MVALDEVPSYVASEALASLVANSGKASKASPHVAPVRCVL